MADRLKGGALLTNNLIKRYFGSDEENYFSVELIAKRPAPADFQGTPQQLTVNTQEDELEARFKIIYSRDSYAVSHGHQWGEGGFGHTVRAGIDGMSIQNLDAKAVNVWRTLDSVNSENGFTYYDERNQFGNLDVPQVYNGSSQRSMEIEFILFRYDDDDDSNDIVKDVNDIRNLTYPTPDGAFTGGIAGYSGSFRYGKPPCLWTIKCSNGAQGLKRAGCNNMNVSYFGPWVGSKGKPTYAVVTMNFTSLYANTFSTDFLDNSGDF